MTKETDINAAAEIADELIDQLDQETDLLEHARKSMDGSHEMLKVLEKSIQHYIDLMKERECDCPVCAETMRQFEHARDAVKKVEQGIPTTSRNPVEAAFLLGTSSALCAFMPTLLLSISETVNAAHGAMSIIINSKVKGFVYDNGNCQNRNDQAEDPNKKPN